MSEKQSDSIKEVRLATTNDAEGIFEVQKSTWLDSYPSKENNVDHMDILEEFSNERDGILNISKSIENYDENNCGWVVEKGREIVGFSATYEKDGRIFVGAVYVLPEYQGQGIGRVLLEKILDFHSDANELWLDVASYNEDAIRFYEKYNFHIVSGSDDRHELRNGRFIPIIKMNREQ
ncbi:GNAT family N-acetyltransferase [Patescibacteria group bacterium]